MAQNIHLCTVIGETVSTIPHYVGHYREIGVNEFHIIVNIKSKYDPFYHEARQALNNEGLKIEQINVGPWNGLINTNLINSCMHKYPNCWFIISDPDELQLYPNNLHELIYQQEKNNISFVTGCFVDRVSISGSLKTLDPYENIWEQYPNCGFISFPLAGANPYKITFCKSSVVLTEGQHGVSFADEEYPVVNDVICQVHHFKWDSSIISRLQSRLRQEEIGEWKNSYKGYGYEVRRILKYFSSNDNRLSIVEPLFLLIGAGNNAYNTYKYWDDIKNITSSWNNLQSYPKLKLGYI